MATEQESLSDDQFMSSLLNDEPEADKPEPKEAEQEPASEGDGKPRDEHGRFKPKTEGEPKPDQPETTASEPKQEQEPEVREERIPSWRLREETEAKRRFEERANALELERRDMERRLSALQRQLEANKPKEELPDMFADPAAFIQTLEQRMERKFEERFLNASLGRAHRQYRDEFEQAYSALVNSGDQALVMRVRQADDPGEALMELYRREKAVREIGPDPNAYRQKLRDDLLKDPEFRKQAMEAWRAEAGQSTARPQNVTPITPSLNKATAAQRNDVDTELGDAEYFASLPRLRR